MLNKTITLKKKTSLNKYGEVVYDNGTNYKARFLNCTKEVWDSKMQKTLSYDILELEPDAMPTTDSLITYNNRTYQIIDVEEILNQRNEVYSWQVSIR